jgi:hypothetical protein
VSMPPAVFVSGAMIIDVAFFLDLADHRSSAGRPPARFTPDGTLRVEPQGPAVQGTQVDFLLPTLKKHCLMALRVAHRFAFASALCENAVPTAI